MKSEIIDIFDGNGRWLGKKEKSEAHKNGDWHRGAHVWLLNKGKIILQKRSSKKDFFPNSFDVACGGHVRCEENFEEALIRELKEEINLDVKKEDFIFLDLRKQVSYNKTKKMISKEILGVFLLFFDGNLKDLKPNKYEISELRSFDFNELRRLLKTKPKMFVDDKKYFFEAIDKIESILTLKQKTNTLLLIDYPKLR